MSICTIFKDIYDKSPNYITVDLALKRIAEGKSKIKINEVRNAIDKDRAQQLKKELPSVCFSGKFKERKDNCNEQHSGFLVLDFDKVEDIGVKIAELANLPFIYAAWLSPSGNGVKALVKLADGKKHRSHFNALKEQFNDVDASGVNESRVCYESYDPNIYINTKATAYTKTLDVERIEQKKVEGDEREIFKKLLKWQSNKGGAFVSGERNTFIFKLAGSCCRFGIWQDNAVNMILTEYPQSNDFTTKEAILTIKSAYRANASLAGSAEFSRDILVDKISRKEVTVTEQTFNPDEPSRAVVYGEFVKANALEIFRNGYGTVSGIDVPEFDMLFKAKKGELTCLTGIGNYGKSALYKWYILMRVIKFGEKFASFAPEDNPPEEYYHDFVEMLLGRNCTPNDFSGQPNLNKPTETEYLNAYDFVSKHIFYLYPKDNSPTPEYIKERFLEMVFKEKVSGVCIDPFNQMVHDYGARSDKYLEKLFLDFDRFAQANSLYFFIIAHPKAMQKDSTGNYPCPDIYDLNDGAMWNNKMYNILVYHRPLAQTAPSDPTCEFHAKKIKRQKIVGMKGFITMNYNRASRRFEFGNNNTDYMSAALRDNGLDFARAIIDYVPKQNKPPIPDNPSAGIPKNYKTHFQNTEKIDNDFFNQ